MAEKQQDVFLTSKPDEQSGSSGTFASEARSYHNPSGYAECLPSVPSNTHTLNLPCMSKSMPARSIRERKIPFKKELKAMEQSDDLPLNFKKTTTYSRPTLFGDVRKSLLTNSGQFCDCPSSEHVLTNASCRLNVILATNQALDFVFEESDNPKVKEIKQDEEDEDQNPLKQELISCLIEADCGAEPFEPFSSEVQKAIAKKLFEFADLSIPYNTDSQCPTPPLKAHKKTELPTPFFGCSEKLDELLSPRDEAIPKQQVQVCAVQVIVSAPVGNLSQQSPQQAAARQTAEEPRAQQIICAAVSRDPRISRTSLDAADPRLTDGKEKYKPKDGNSEELSKVSFDFKEDDSGNAPSKDNGHLKDNGSLTNKNKPRDQGAPENKSLLRSQGPSNNKSVPIEQKPPNQKSLPRNQGPPKDKCPPKPLTPEVTKAVPPPAALTQHVHKEKGCEFCSNTEDAQIKETSTESLPAKLSERRNSSKENNLECNNSGNANTVKQPLRATHNAPSVGSSANKNVVPPVATHRIPCSTAVAMSSYRIPKKPLSSSQPLKPIISMDVSKIRSSIKPAIKLNSTNNVQPQLPPKDRSVSEKNNTSDQLLKRASDLPKPGLSKKSEAGNISRSKSVKELSSDKKSKEKYDTSPHVHSSSKKTESVKTKHISQSSASKPEKSKTELKCRRFSEVDIFAPSSTSTKATVPKLAVSKERKKETLSGPTSQADKSSKSKAPTDKDRREPVKLSVPPVVSSKDENVTKSKTSSSVSDLKKPAPEAIAITKNDSRSQTPATKEKTVLASESPATHKERKLSTTELPPVPKSLKDPAVAPATLDAGVDLGTELPASKHAKNLLQTLFGDGELQTAAAKSSRCELKVVTDLSTLSSGSKESKQQDKPIIRKSKLSLPKKTKQTKSPTSDSLSKSVSATAESDKVQTVPDLSSPAHKVTNNLKTSDEKKQLDSANIKVPSTAAKSKLSLPKSTQQQKSSSSESVSKSTSATTESAKDKSLLDSSVLGDNVPIDLKIGGEKIQLDTADTKIPLKEANSCTHDKDKTVSSSDKRNSKLFRKNKKLKRKSSDASEPKLPVKMLIISGKDIPSIRREYYTVLHTEEISKPKKSRKLHEDDDDYQPSSMDEIISACELTSDGSTSQAEHSSDNKLSARAKQRKHSSSSSSSSSSDSETNSSSSRKDRASRHKLRRDKQEQNTPRKSRNNSSKRPSSSSSKKHSGLQRRTSRARITSSSNSDSETEKVDKKRRLASKSPKPSTSGKKKRVRMMQLTDSSEEDEATAAPAQNSAKVSKKRRLATKSPQPSTSGTQKYVRIVPPPDTSDTSEDEQPTATVAPVVTKSCKINKEISGTEQSLVKLETPVSATPVGPPKIPDSFELSDDDVYTDDELHDGKIAGENPRIIDLYNCITPEMSFIITSTCTNLVVVGKFREKNVEPPPPAPEIISEVVISKEPDDDEVVSYVCQKKPAPGPMLIDLESSEDEEPQTFRVESSPSPDPIVPSPNQVSGISDTHETIDAGDLCAETLSERLEPEMVLPSAVKPVAAPPPLTLAQQQPESRVGGQQNLVQTVPSCQQNPVVPTVGENNIPLYTIQTTIDQRASVIKFLVVPNIQPQLLERVDNMVPQPQDLERIEQEKQRQELVKKQKQQQEFERLRKKKEQEDDEMKKKKLEDDEKNRKKQEEENENKKKQEEENEKKKKEEENEKKKKQEENLERQRKEEEEIEKLEEELKKQTKKLEELERLQVEQKERQQKEHERLREAKRWEEEQKRQQLQRQEQERLHRQQLCEKNKKQQASIQPSPFQQRIAVVNLQKLQHQNADQNQSKQPPPVQHPTPAHQQRQYAHQQHRVQQPQMPVQLLTAPRQTHMQQARVTPQSRPQPAVTQVASSEDQRIQEIIHQQVALNLARETPEENLRFLGNAASYVTRNLNLTTEGKNIRATVTFHESLMTAEVKCRLMKCCFSSWLVDSLPSSSSIWEKIINIVLMAMKRLENGDFQTFLRNMQAAKLNATLTRFLIGIQHHTARVFFFPCPKDLVGFNVSLAKRASHAQRDQREVLDEFINKLSADGVLEPEKTLAGNYIVYTPQLRCPLLQVLADGYIVKFLRIYQKRHPESMRTKPPTPATAQPMASTSTPAANVNDVMVINPHATFLFNPMAAAEPAVLPGVTHQTMRTMTHGGNQTTVVNTTVISSTVQHRPAAVTLMQPLQNLPIALTNRQTAFTVGDLVESMVLEEQKRQRSQRQQPPPPPTQPPPMQPPPPMRAPPATPMMLLNQHQVYTGNLQMQSPYMQQQTYQLQYVQPNQTVNWGGQVSNDNYDHQLYQRSRQDLQDQQTGSSSQQTWQHCGYQQQQYQIQNQQPVSNVYQQQMQTQSYHQQMPGQTPVQQPQQQWPQPSQIKFAQQPTASPSVPTVQSHGSADYLQQHLGLQMEQMPADLNTNPVGMEIDGNESGEEVQLYDPHLESLLRDG